MCRKEADVPVMAQGEVQQHMKLYCVISCSAVSYPLALPMMGIAALPSESAEG